MQSPERDRTGTAFAGELHDWMMLVWRGAARYISFWNIQVAL
jgi:hypothetical protein